MSKIKIKEGSSDIKKGDIAVNDRLEGLMKERGLIKVIHSHDKITGVINLDDALNN